MCHTQLNGGFGALPTFHLGPLSFEYSARQKCILSFGGDCSLGFVPLRVGVSQRHPRIDIHFLGEQNPHPRHCNSSSMNRLAVYSYLTRYTYGHAVHRTSARKELRSFD